MDNNLLNILESKVDDLINANKKLKDENLDLKKKIEQNTGQSVDFDDSDSDIDDEKSEIIKKKIKSVLKKIERLEPFF